MSERAGEDALRAAVRQLALSADLSSERDDAFARVRARLRAVFEDTMQYVAAELNDSNKWVSLPPELLCYIAKLLPLRDRIRGALVCRHWRYTLIAAPFLWSSITISFESRTNLWVDIVDGLLARSAGQPLALDLQYRDEALWFGDNDPNASTIIKGVAKTVASNMYRMRSLTLVIPGIDGVHEHWADVLKTHAPIVEKAVIYATDSYYQIPTSLFAGSAPGLRSLYPQYFHLAQPVPPALLGITTLYCDRFDDESAACIAQLAALHTLTIASWSPLPSQTVCVQDIDLFLAGSESTARDRADVLRVFPRAKSVQYSLQHTYGDDASWVLGQAFPGDAKVTSVSIRWSRQLAAVPWEGIPADEIRLTIDLNSAFTAVDVDSYALLHYLASDDVVERWSQYVETATFPEAVWDVFLRVATPLLKEVTILLDERDDYGPASLFCTAALESAVDKPALATLRFSCQQTPPQRHRSVAIPALYFAHHVRATCRHGTLRNLILRDIVLVEPGITELGDVVEAVRYEDSCYCVDADEPKPWTWEFPMDEAISL
ncbi:hypothetical protein EXIGLDRAFT_838587 [Exidia glandulosa HHB12029]|uniref:F-box domain-containing protein n=1 Tax=Exidia glandulosa HHB12029 TaxID=1314781 RepID=A0A165FPM7_EXIGL|nr:hypothetical protein EXIGLDRAFT_838587 [Exidia glandulosa HHB12029]